MKKNKSYYTATTIAVLLWSASFIATKIAYLTFSPLMVGFIRFFIASLILGTVRVFCHETIKPAKKDRIIIALSGLLGITLYFAAENIGVQLTTASNASLIVASYPAITAMFEFFIFHIKPDIKRITGIFLAFFGVGILTVTQFNGSTTYALLGNLILIAAGIIWTFYNFTTRSITGKYSPLTLSYYQMLYGTIFFLPLILAEHGTVHTITFPSILALIYLSCGCSVAAFLLYNYGLRKLSAATSISLMNLVPVFGLFFSGTILHETISLRQICGGFIVIIGVILSTNTVEK